NMNARFLDSGSDAGQRVRLEPNTAIELERPGALLRRQKGEGNSRNVSFLTAQTRPKCRCDDLFNYCAVRLPRIRILICRGALRDARLEALRHDSCRRI